jgi:hypothetical protein
MYDLEQSIVKQIDAMADRIRQIYDPAVRQLHDESLSKAGGDKSRVSVEVGDRNLYQRFSVDGQYFGSVLAIYGEDGPAVETWKA